MKIDQWIIDLNARLIWLLLAKRGRLQFDATALITDINCMIEYVKRNNSGGERLQQLKRFITFVGLLLN